MSEHTEGPWTYCGADRGGCQCMMVLCRDHPVAKIISGDWGDDYPAIRLTGHCTLDAKAEAYMAQFTYGHIDEKEAKANAYLIAAAPELLKAAQIAWELLRYQPRQVTPETDTARKLLEAAIAKAENRP